MVEHAAHNRGVAGSIPATATNLLDELARSPLLEPRRRLLVALSGGPDSTALLIALRELGHDVVAAHFDHGLRPGSDADAVWVTRLCRSLGVALVSERNSVPRTRGSVQAQARRRRYEFLTRACDAVSAQAIAVGHTADDLVEGMLLNLMRGCGVSGLRGIPEVNGRVIRPLLHVWRRDVVAFLEAREIEALQDPSNSDETYARVRVRRRLLPALEQARPGISLRLRTVAANAARLAGQLDQRTQGLGLEGRIPRSLLEALPEVEAVDALKQLYGRAGGNARLLTRRHYAAMLRLSRGRAPGEVSLPGGFVFLAGYEQVEVADTAAHRSEPLPRIRVRRCAAAHHDHSATQAHLRFGDVRIGTRVAGLRMRPLGGRGTRKLQDILVDARVPRRRRDALPLVFLDERLAWVPGIALDADSAAVPGQPCVEVTLEFDFSSQDGC